MRTHVASQLCIARTVATMSAVDAESKKNRVIARQRRQIVAFVRSIQNLVIRSVEEELGLGLETVGPGVMMRSGKSLVMGVSSFGSLSEAQ